MLKYKNDSLYTPQCGNSRMNMLIVFIHVYLLINKCIYFSRDSLAAVDDDVLWADAAL